MAAASLGRVAGDFFARVLLVHEAPGAAPPDASPLRAQLLDELAALDAHPFVQRLDAQQRDDARFALAVWADELLLKTPWPGRDAWAHDLLQMRLYRTNRGGDEFFDRLARLRPDHGEARGVYFLCLVFGFEGQLVGDEPARRALLQQHFDMLRASGLARDLVTAERLTPEAYALEIELEPPPSGGARRILFGWAAAAALVFVLAWGALRLLAERVALPPGS